MRFTRIIGAFSLLAGAYAAIGPTANLHIGNKVISPDGFSRSAVLAGSNADSLTFPGPVISGSKGSTFRLNVINALTDTTMLRSTSIHWHGMFQQGSNWADGAVGVTQCPIAPGHSFLYQFSVPDQTGTYWYHAHHSTQYCDGLRGALVVYDLDDPHKNEYDFDAESTIITLADWYHKTAPSAGLGPNSDSTLINGLGRYAGGPAVPLTVIQVEPHKRYRFRLISISCEPNYVFSIDGHTMTIIEVDGVSVQPLAVDSLQIFAGQRFSFVLNANQPIANYWIRAQPNVGPKGFAGGVNSAILRYIGAPEADPTTTQTPPSSRMLETNLHPLSNPGAPGIPSPGAADVNINLKIDFNFTNMKFTVNGATFAPPTLPVLLQIMSGAQTAQDLLPSGSVYALPPNKVIEISIPGGGSPHPIHLHGHNFDVVRSAGSAVYNYVDPVKRDVVSAGAKGDNVTIRFATDNAGPGYFTGAHNEWHLEMGLAIVMAEDIPTIATSDPPPAWDELCPTYKASPPETFPRSVMAN